MISRTQGVASRKKNERRKEGWRRKARRNEMVSRTQGVASRTMTRCWK